MKHMIQAVIFIALGLFATTTASANIIMDFLKFGGITYVSSGREWSELREEYLGAEVTKVRFNIVWADGQPAPEPSFGPDEAYAAWLDVGTSIHAVKGYATTFRLAARRDGRIWIYENYKNPKARKGADLLDLGDNVAYIGINNAGRRNSNNEIAAIRDSTLLARLVRMVLDAPVNQHNSPTGPWQPSRGGTAREPLYRIVIHFRDGTMTSRAYRLNSGELSGCESGNIMLPPDFANAVRDSVKRAGDSPPNSLR